MSIPKRGWWGDLAFAKGVCLAPILNPAGVVAGLERVRMIPSAMGGARSVISFGLACYKGA